jgi:hypothetical protein
MIYFFFWFMAIWIFIQILSDIFRRHDLSGGWKAIWILIIFVLPFLGCLIYMVSRPVTDQDRAAMQQMAAASGPAGATATGYSAADEIEKLGKLRDAGQITPAEFEAAKKHALGI